VTLDSLYILFAKVLDRILYLCRVLLLDAESEEYCLVECDFVLP